MKKITKIEDNADLHNNRKTRTAAYCRVSTSSSEQMASLETQKTHYENYIKSNDEWEYVGLYYDEGVTGTKKEYRNGLLTLISDCEKGLIDLVITKSISRFSRNTTDCLELVRKLIDMNVTVIFEKENINTSSMESELMLSVLSSLAEDESVSVSENSKWSIQKRFQNGTFVIAYPPYGYKNVDGKMVIVSEQANIVKQIFIDTLAGKGADTIARSLNDKNILSKRGGKWTADTVRGIIRNEKYTGDVIFQKTYTDSNYMRHTNKGERNSYYCKNHHEPVISHDIYEKANEIINQRSKEKGNGKNTERYQNRYGFSGRIKCGECGGTFKRRTHYKPSGSYVAWCCVNHISNKSSCSMKYITDESIKAAFLTMMNKLVFACQPVLHPLLNGIKLQGNKERLIQTDRYVKMLEDNMEKRQVLMSLMADGLLEPAIFSKENSKLLQEERQLKEKKKMLSGSESVSDEKIVALKSLIKAVSIKKPFKKYEDELFVAHINHITVISRNEIEFVLKCGLKLKERLV